MALSNYTELKTAIANWLHRSDLTSVIPDFITMAESRINRELPARVNDIDVPLTATIGSRFVALPVDFVSPYALFLTTITPRELLEYRDNRALEVCDDSGWPTYWTINGANIELDYNADQAHTFTFKYRRGFALTDASPTNWLLTTHPDLYLYGALLESSPYIKDDERLMLWQNRYDLALSQIRTKEIESQSIATLGTEIAAVNMPYANTNIISGE